MFGARWQMGKAAMSAFELCGMDFEKFDAYAAHVVVTRQEDDAVIAIGSILPDPVSGETQITRIAAMPDFSDMPYDELVLRIILDKLRRLCGQKIVMLAGEGEQKLLSRFGFVPVSGDFADDKARKKVCVLPENVVWEKDCIGKIIN